MTGAADDELDDGLAGDGAEEYIFDRLLKDKLIDLLTHTGSSWQEAEDIVADVEKALWKRRANTALDPIRDVESFARAVAINARNHRLRSDRRRLRREARAQAEAHRAFSDAIRCVEHRDCLKKILAVLPPRQREAFYLRYFEDCSREQIAEVMQIDLHTVKRHLSLALNRLRREGDWVLEDLRGLVEDGP